MNIKEHIEQGHYPKDTEGHALVPTRCGAIATICCTDYRHDVLPILGWFGDPTNGRQWQAGGRMNLSGESEFDLLPPQPRKAKVRAILERQNGRWVLASANDQTPEALDGVVVELSGEYEEPWS